MGNPLLIPPDIRSWNGAAKAVSDIWAADSLRGRFARGAVWSLIGAVLAQGANLAASVITARLLGREQFGEYGIVQSTVGMLGVFAGLGLGVTATKYVAEFRTRDPERAGRIIALGCAVAIISGGLLALCLLFFAPLLAATTLHAPTLAGELRIVSVALFFNAINGAQTGALSGFEAFRAIARINLARGLLSFPVTVAAVVLWRLPGAVWALAITAAVTCVLSEISLQRHCRDLGISAPFRSSWEERRVLWTFSMPAVFSSALVGPVFWVANTLLVKRPGGYGEMGVFSAASQWRNAILFLPTLAGQVVLPMLSSLQGEEGRRPARRVLLAAISVNIAFALPIVLALLFLSGRVMALYGPGFASRGAVLRITAITAGLLATQTPVGNIIAAAGRMWLGALMNLGWATVLLISALSLLGRGWGADGLAYAFLLAYVAHATWTFWFAGTVLRPAAHPRLPSPAAVSPTEFPVDQASL
jgi:O-antigen/teichoic acid export membrane protein